MEVDLLMAKSKGVTLVELLVAVAIMATVILSVIGLFSQSMSLNATGRDYTTVNSLARDRLEELMGLPFSDPLLEVPPGSTEASFPDDLSDMYLERTYRVREMRLQKTDEAAPADTQLSTPVTGGNGNLKEITVIVRSTRPLLGRREISVTTLKADGLLQ